MKKSIKNRCGWCLGDPLYIEYHDKEWGKSSKDDIHLFEMLNLEGAQAGLSWLTILKKRKNYFKAFSSWNPKRVAKFSSSKQASLLKDVGIVRNRLKIASAIQNAKAFLKVQKEFGSFSKYLWNWVEGKQIINKPKTLKEIPAKTPLSDEISKDLKKRGFKFVGSTIIYAYLQAVGVIDDHEVGCISKNKK